MKKRIHLIKTLLVLSAMMIVWKWSTILVLELSNINYDLTEKVLRYFVLGGIACLVVAGAVLFLKEY